MVMAGLISATGSDPGGHARRASHPQYLPEGTTPRNLPQYLPGGATPRNPPQYLPGGATPRNPPQYLPGGATPRSDSQSQHAPSVPLDKSVLSEDEIRRALTRIGHEILERTHGGADVVLLGIPTRGVPLARRLAAKLAETEGIQLAVGSLDITLYRDDLRLRPTRALGRTEVPVGGIDQKVVVLVDDVLYSGRTVRAALDALNDIGRPRAVQLAVLVDRGHRELPIRADYVGKNLPTSQHEVVRVMLAETDGVDSVTLLTSPEVTR